MAFIIEGISYAEFQTFLKSEIETAFQTFASNKMQQVETGDTTQQLLTRKQAAQKLGISLPTLNQWTKDGIIVAYRISSRVRYRLKDVEASLIQVNSTKAKRRAPGR